MSERITSVYPDISLCDEGCFMDGVDLVSITALCSCKFNGITNNNVIRDNAILDRNKILTSIQNQNRKHSSKIEHQQKRIHQ